MRPEKLAVRAVNQYRRRDILAYLGLRYYLENEATKRDIWARKVSTFLVNGRNAPIYFCSHHFKEIADEGNVSYRNIYVPGPNEILAETVLLYECSLDTAFGSMGCVYSYKFPSAHSKEGMFRSYFPRYRSRHQSIARACASLDQARVQYTDIRKFYPSIPIELARETWKATCDLSRVSTVIRELGERLLDEHFEVAVQQRDGSSILTGPMFSHLIANLVLFDIDKRMYEEMHGNYWRYVDDIVLVGDAKMIKDKRELLKSMLDDLGLSLHDEEKDFNVDAEHWLEGVNDFNDSNGELWMNLISNIKRYLTVKPEARADLLAVFADNGINLPIMDYATAAAESSFREKLTDSLRKYSWFPRSIQHLSIQKLVTDAIHVRNVYQEKLFMLFDGNSLAEGYKRKRLLPKLRFYASRLSYLAVPEALTSISASLRSYPEMLLEATVMQAVQSQDVTQLLKFGANAVQAAAQIFRINKNLVTSSLDALGDVEIQGIAVLKLNGIDIKLIDQLTDKVSNDQLNQFANGDDPRSLMKSSDTFIREIACLRGVENPLRHQALLDTAFDRDEHMVFDVINQLRDSSYF